jgi:hypothetical protein
MRAQSPAAASPTAPQCSACRFKLSVTLTSPQPQQAGMVYARVRAAKKSATFIIDPFLALSSDRDL